MNLTVKNALLSLGDSIDEIAASLLKLGIKGVRGALPYMNNDKSLISQFVMLVGHSMEHVDWYITERNSPLRILVDFDDAFDDGKFPELQQ